MIGNIVPGRGFGGSIRYDLEKDGAQILDTNTIGGIAASPDEIAREMAEHVARENPRLKHSLFHISISAAPGEHLTDEQWRALTRAYLDKMGFANTHYVATRHADTDHDHVHITVSRVDFDGNTISDSNDFIRQEQALDEIEQQFGLRRVREEMRQKIRENPMVALENMLSQRSRVNEDQLARQIARYVYDPAEREAMKQEILSDKNTIFLGKDEKGRALYTTRECVAEWLALRRDIEALNAQRHDTIRRREKEATPTGIKFEGDQRIAIDAATSARGLVFITGFAGVGKTTLMSECRREWDAQDKEILGCSLQAVAAKKLQAETGIKSSSLTMLVQRLERGEQKLGPNSVIVLDECFMSDNTQLSSLLRHARIAGAAVRFVGDKEQIGSVARGGAADMARKIAGEVIVKTVRRQRTEWEKAATVSFGEGRAAEAVKAYIDHDRLRWASSLGTAKTALAAACLRELDAGRPATEVLAMAHRRADVRDINDLIRQGLKERGQLADEQTYIVPQTESDAHGNEYQTERELRLAVGDRVMLTRNDYRTYDVRNGDTAEVIATDARTFTIRTDEGRAIKINVADYNDITYGYALTLHKSQGAGKECGKLLLTRSTDSRTTCVGLTRHKADVEIFAPRTHFENEADLVKSVTRRPPADGLDGFNLDDTETANMESDYDDQRRDLTRTHRELAARRAPALESAAETDLQRPGAEATRIGRDALRLLPGSDLAGAIGGRVDRTLHDLPRGSDAAERDLELRGLQHGRARPGEEGERAVTHYESFADLQRAVRAQVAERGLSNHTAALARREAFEPDTLKLSPTRTHSPTQGSHLVARSRATGQEEILTDRDGQRFQFESGAEALEARNAVRDLAHAATGKPSERPEHHIPDQREADQYHMTREIKTEAKLGGVELRGPDNERRPELAEPSEHALDLVALAGQGQYQLRAEPNERGGWRLEFYDKTNTTAPEILTNSAGRQLAYESKAEAERDLSRLGALAEEQIQAQDRENDRGGRSR